MLALGLLCPFSPFALSLSLGQDKMVERGLPAERRCDWRNEERERLNRQWRRDLPFDETREGREVGVPGEWRLPA